MRPDMVGSSAGWSVLMVVMGGRIDFSGSRLVEAHTLRVLENIEKDRPQGPWIDNAARFVSVEDKRGRSDDARRGAELEVSRHRFLGGRVLHARAKAILVHTDTTELPGHALGIELVPPPDLGMGSIPANNPMLEEGALMFSIDGGESVSCQLMEADDGSCEGECVDSTGGAAIMTMIPPDEG